MKNKKKLIAFYLPQFHPTQRNDEWWGKGFTEWTNVAKAKKLYPGHYQPHIPADLGFYDLRLPETREAQALMAKEAGVYGFCYYHYWFEQGFEELERPFDEVVHSGNPDFPFCLCWANESWYSKFWNMDGTVDKKILAEQKYLGYTDNEAHFYRLLPAFKDKRYITKDNRLLFVIYKPFDFQNIQEFMNQWNDLAKKNGLNGFYFIAYSLYIKEEYSALKEMGFDEIISCRLYTIGRDISILERTYKKLIRILFKKPYTLDFSRFYHQLNGFEERKNDVIPTIIPNWDHTPRSKRGGIVFENTTPDIFDKHVNDTIRILEEKDAKEVFCFLKSWNEWGEGNYVEPDLKYGHGYLEVLKKHFK